MVVGESVEGGRGGQGLAEIEDTRDLHDGEFDRPLRSCDLDLLARPERQAVVDHDGVVIQLLGDDVADLRHLVLLGTVDDHGVLVRILALVAEIGQCALKLQL